MKGAVTGKKGQGEGAGRVEKRKARLNQRPREADRPDGTRMQDSQRTTTAKQAVTSDPFHSGKKRETIKKKEGKGT